MRTLDQAGVKIVVASGRAPAACASAFRAAGLHGWACSCNAASVTDIATGEILHRAPVPHEVTRAVLDICETEDMNCTIFTDDEILVGRQDFLAEFVEASNDGVNCRVADLRAVDPDSVLKLMPGAEPAKMADVFPRIRQICPGATLSLDFCCEVIGEGCDKADGIRLLLDRLGIAPEKVAGFGDGGNDVNWMKLIGWPIAMQNARDEVKQVARLEIGHHLEDAVADFIAEWDQARRARQ